MYSCTEISLVVGTPDLRRTGLLRSSSEVEVCSGIPPTHRSSSSYTIWFRRLPSPSRGSASPRTCARPPVHRHGRRHPGVQHSDISCRVSVSTRITPGCGIPGSACGLAAAAHMQPRVHSPHAAAPGTWRRAPPRRLLPAWSPRGRGRRRCGGSRRPSGCTAPGRGAVRSPRTAAGSRASLCTCSSLQPGVGRSTSDKDVELRAALPNREAEQQASCGQRQKGLDVQLVSVSGCSGGSKSRVMCQPAPCSTSRCAPRLVALGRCRMPCCSTTRSSTRSPSSASRSLLLSAAAASRSAGELQRHVHCRQRRPQRRVVRAQGP